MVVFSIDNAPDNMRGMITRWLLEIKPGVFVGNVSTRVRVYIWEKIICKDLNVSAIMIYSYPTEQGFIFDMYGMTERHLNEYDGVQLVERQSHDEHKNDKKLSQLSTEE